MLWIIWNGIEETFAKPKWLANKCGFSEPTGLLALAISQSSKTAQIAAIGGN